MLRTVKVQRLHPSCKLVGNLLLFRGCWPLTWDSWVRDKGPYHSQNNEQHEHDHVCIDSHRLQVPHGRCTGPRWMLHMQRVCDAAKEPGVEDLALFEQGVNIVESSQQASFPTTGQGAVPPLLTLSLPCYWVTLRLAIESAPYQQTDQSCSLTHAARTCTDAPGPWQTASLNNSRLPFKEIDIWGKMIFIFIHIFTPLRVLYSFIRILVSIYYHFPSTWRTYNFSEVQIWW